MKMKIDERIIRYFDNQMDELERKKFEEDLKNSSDLTIQVEYYKDAFQKLKIKDEILSEEDYFNNLVPRFREKLTAKRGKPKFQIAYSLSGAVLILMIAMLYFNPFKTKENLSLESLITSFDEQEKFHLYRLYESDTILPENSDEYSTEDLYNLFIKEINLQDYDIAKMDAYGNLSMEEIMTQMQDDEVDAIYDKILNTKYF